MSIVVVEDCCDMEGVLAPDSSVEGKAEKVIPWVSLVEVAVVV